MTQLGIDWSRDVSLPVSGRTQQARHAGATGAAFAGERRGKVALDYRQLLISAGPLSDDEAARALGKRLSSICSTRNGWGARVVPSGQFEETEFGTRRVRWSWRDSRGDQ